MKRLLLMLAVACGVVYVGCKEGDGDRCQVNSDCKSGSCNRAEGICTTTESEAVDADLPPDAPPADAVPDAPPTT